MQCHAVEVIAPTLSFRIVSVPICLLFATNMFAHYYYVCTVSPGFADDPPSTVTTRQGSSWIWAKQKETRHGVRWSDEPGAFEPYYNKCKRCGVQRPEVCPCLQFPIGGIACLRSHSSERGHIIVKYVSGVY